MSGCVVLKADTTAHMRELFCYSAVLTCATYLLHPPEMLFVRALSNIIQRIKEYQKKLLFWFSLLILFNNSGNRRKPWTQEYQTHFKKELTKTKEQTQTGHISECWCWARRKERRSSLYSDFPQSGRTMYSWMGKSTVPSLDLG